MARAAAQARSPYKRKCTKAHTSAPRAVPHNPFHPNTGGVDPRAGCARDRANDDGKPVARALHFIDCGCGERVHWRGWGNAPLRCRRCQRAHENALQADWRARNPEKVVEYRQRDAESYTRGSAVSPTRELSDCDARWQELLGKRRYESVPVREGNLIVIEPPNPQTREIAP